MNVEDAAGFSSVSVKRNWSTSNSPDLSDGAGDTESDLQMDEMIRSVAGLSCSDPCETISCSDTEDLLQRVKDQHKISMKNRFERLYEGVHLTHLNKIYTQLFITKDREEVKRKPVKESVVNEDYVKYLFKSDSTPHQPINCNHIFRAAREENSDQENHIKTVLTRGIAGIGKSVSVQKFILDWAEGKDNQDVDFVFALPFRKLNLIKRTQYSLHRLLLDFHPELEDLDSEFYKECEVLFVLDGFDHSTEKLVFSEEQKVSDVNESSSVSLLIWSLITGDLLPAARIWITSRLAAANQIPPQYISRVTEIQGFRDAQQEEYFRKRISDEDEATRILSLIRRSPSLHHMCHIPVFCWISATVLQNILKQDDTAEIPQTLTEMYIRFLLLQVHARKQTFEENDPEKLLRSSREVVVKLSELAYNQLMKGSVMFYEEDLRESGIDATVHHGVLTQIVREESVVLQRKVFCFIHLSFHEFLAAFHKLYRVVWNDTHAVLFPFLPFPKHSDTNSLTLDVLLDAAVDDSLQSESGSLDLYLRFLLGISMESSQRLLQDLLTHTVKSSDTITNITQKIKKNLKADGLSADTRINLLLCLLEMKGPIQPREVLQGLKFTRDNPVSLTVSHCSVIAYLIQISEEVLNNIDLKSVSCTLEGFNRLIPAVINCRRTRLLRMSLSDGMLESFSSCLQSPNSKLRKLDLSLNDLQESGLKILSDGLKSPNCRLEKLILRHCLLTDGCCEILSLCLQSPNSSLRNLILCENPQLTKSGVKILTDGLKSPNCRLEKLRLDSCSLTDGCCVSLSSCLQSPNSSLRELDLYGNDIQDAGLKILSDGLKSSNCRLEKLRLDFCSITDRGCESLSSCLQSPNSSLRDLDLIYTRIQDSGVKILSDGLKSPNCRLKILSLSNCSLTDGCCESLSSCLQSPNSSLRELDLSVNPRLTKSGVKILSDGLKSPNCRLDILSLRECSLTDGCCESLSSCLQSPNSSLRELDLSENPLLDSGVKILSDGLKSPNCRLEKLRLNKCGLSDGGWERFSSILKPFTGPDLKGFGRYWNRDYYEWSEDELAED